MKNVNYWMDLIKAGKLGELLRGERCFFRTPSKVDADMLPTDHCELLRTAIYPLSKKYGELELEVALNEAIAEIVYDGLGFYCAIQVLYVEIANESMSLSPLRIDRIKLPVFLGNSFFTCQASLLVLNVDKYSSIAEWSYNVTLSRMRMLSKNYGIDWGVNLPDL